MIEGAKDRLRGLGIDPGEIEESFIRSGGKGGQNVNKVSTCVQLVWSRGGIVVRCETERSQAANRGRAWVELVRRVEDVRRRAAEAARQAREAERRRTRRPPRKAREKRLESKRRRSDLKRSRGSWSE